jgi:hypothetical protein
MSSKDTSSSVSQSVVLSDISAKRAAKELIVSRRFGSELAASCDMIAGKEESALRAESSVGKLRWRSMIPSSASVGSTELVSGSCEGRFETFSEPASIEEE